ncbi:hypothetical protein DSS3P8_183 [Roseobacter phage DSS3P8]|nr:hypothetical protein DSS3P8_183 [Roseobacter phage DSS3P8]
MKDRLRKALTRLLPMTCIDGCLFIDKVSGEEVGEYVDRDGQHWMATSRWDLFRVSMSF